MRLGAAFRCAQASGARPKERPQLLGLEGRDLTLRFAFTQDALERDRAQTADERDGLRAARDALAERLRAAELLRHGHSRLGQRRPGDHPDLAGADRDDEVQA